jgi:hypothetical protein
LREWFSHVITKLAVKKKSSPNPSKVIQNIFFFSVPSWLEVVSLVFFNSSYGFGMVFFFFQRSHIFQEFLAVRLVHCDGSDGRLCIAIGQGRL